MYIPVKDAEGNIQLLHVSQDTLFMQTDQSGNLLFHTDHGAYQSIRRVEEWASLLHKVGFLRVDRGTIVNLNKAWLFDSTLRVLKPLGMIGSIVIPVSGKSVDKLHQTLNEVL
ncbi:LytTR family transcriptional regulator DNA-binding domain-containing protein [Paenibacillus sepulcri]|uniref:LytTR family transcriptional regulator DNA-binding domain-containing protein n=1 Tax=Paenibacillus sepulcri TaxID=359917 RepID=A0ABS7BW94_9BACL|nr:LytTR family transcriptional regulator DNA-binding domain-containing protein [Paenibacillus sepulcri]